MKSKKNRLKWIRRFSAGQELLPVDHQGTEDEATSTKDDPSVISGVLSRQEKSEKKVVKSDKTEATSKVENVEKVAVARCKFIFLYAPRYMWYVLVDVVSS